MAKNISTGPVVPLWNINRAVCCIGLFQWRYRSSGNNLKAESQPSCSQPHHYPLGLWAPVGIRYSKNPTSSSFWHTGQMSTLCAGHQLAILLTAPLAALWDLTHCVCEHSNVQAAMARLRKVLKCTAITQRPLCRPGRLSIGQGLAPCPLQYSAALGKELSGPPQHHQLWLLNFFKLGFYI